MNQNLAMKQKSLSFVHLLTMLILQSPVWRSSHLLSSVDKIEFCGLKVMKKISKLCLLFGNNVWCSCETVLLQQSLLTLPCLISFLGSLAGKALGLSCAGNVLRTFLSLSGMILPTLDSTTESCLVFLSLQLVQSFVSKTATFSLATPMLREGGHILVS